MGSKFTNGMISDTDFANLSDAAKRPLATLISACELTNGNATAALVLLDPEKTQQISASMYWRTKVQVAIHLGSMHELVATLAAMQKQVPNALMTLGENWYFDIDSRLKKSGDLAGR